MMKTRYKILIPILALVIVLVTLVGWVMMQMPPHGAARVEAAPGVVGVETGGSYAWIIRTPHGAALVDAGMNQDGKAIIDELARESLTPESVHTIFITHGHIDHIGALLRFPRARVWVAAADAELMRGQRLPKALLPRLFDKLMTLPPVPVMLSDLSKVDKVEADGATFTILHTPGHTAGSSMFLHDKTLFTGDALFGNKGALMYPPAFICDDPAQSRASVAALQSVDFDRIADGHAGVTEHAHEKLSQLH